MSIDRPATGRPASPLRLASPKSGSAEKAPSPVSPLAASQSVDSTASSSSRSSTGRRGRRVSPREAEMNRVQEELEKLNIATDVINKLELQLDDARSAFGEIRSSWSSQLESLSRKLGGCIAKSRPFYEARLRAKQVQEEAQKAALRFERANSMHAVAKQQVALTQDSLFRQDPKDVDPACLEVLNHHVQRVNEAERERLTSEEEHRRISRMVEEANKQVQQLEKELGRNIKKSKVYFDRRLEFTRVLEDQKGLIQRIELEVKQKKADYQTSLRNLELISERIHEERALSAREPGVGEESPPSVESDATQTPPRTPDESVSTLLVRIEGTPKDGKGLSPKVKDLLSALSPNRSSSKSSRSVSEPPESSPGDTQSSESPSGRDRLNSIPGATGVLLIAQQLQEYGWLPDSASAAAFQFPPEDLDVSYKTLPEGVKAVPSPPQTPADTPRQLAIPSLEADAASLASARSDQSGSSLPGHSRNPSNWSDSVSMGGEESDGSWGPGHSDGEGLRGMLRSHTAMIREIETTADRIKSQVTDLSADRQSGSGESS